MTEKKERPKWVKWMIRVVVAMLVGSAFVGGCSQLNKKAGLDDDHIFEEILEHHIEEQTGLDVDLSPSSKEK